MDNYEKLMLIRDELTASKHLIDEIGIKTNLKHIAGFSYSGKNTRLTFQSNYKPSAQFDLVFPRISEFYEKCDSALNPTITGMALLTCSTLNVDPKYKKSAHYDDIFFESCSDTGDWHSHRKHGSQTRSFTAHFPLWCKDESIKFDEIEYEVDVINDFSLVTSLNYEEAKVKSNELFDAGQSHRIMCKGNTFLDFRSSFLHRAHLKDDLILCSIVFNYQSKTNNPDVLDFIDFETNLSFDDLSAKLPGFGKRCNENLCVEELFY